MNFVPLYVIVIFIPAIVGEEYQQCKPWMSIEEKLKQTVLKVNCTHTTTCTGMSCHLENYGYEVHSGIHMNPCENPSSLEFEVDVPKLNINQWKRKFYHGDSFSLNDNVGGKFEILKENETFILSLTLEFHSNGLPSALLHLLPTVLPDLHIPVTSVPLIQSPLLSKTAALQENSNCSIRNSSCPEYELCQQIDKSKPAGICVCVPDYVRDKSGNCIYRPSFNTTTETPGGHSHHDTTSNTSLLLTAVLVPIIVLIIIGVALFGFVRFHVCQRIRRRLRVQVYEHVLLGQDDEIEDDSSNPIA
ncbi:uncharacterized protein TNIN_194741 [Trichonephila inaurata madagascariensis]|uniref:EGF-like domain-containing protein n=1 Tax=Trichonephila inaurata madagascariensis TaxID=2747483 RepID=A0A8X7C952_9ARAC|nr:uncharacterized protein TNIN_194741 [Trichonephila inaurata madagascariensis]